MIPKFRAWDNVEKKFVEHFFITDNGLICNMEKPTSDRKLLIPIEKSELILMQSTGLKDKNGKEIFEGDIISDGHTSRDIRHHQTLGFYTIDGNGVEGFFGDTASLEDFEEVSKYISENIEIIGNIYENKDILEDKE